MEKIIALAKRRGFFFPSSEIYGGLANTWDFGHYGTLLKNNLRDWWWKKFVLERDDIVAVDTSVILNPKVWQASGHVQGFNDVLIECRNCHYRTRADSLIEEKNLDIKTEGLTLEEMEKIIWENKLPCPRCQNFNWIKPRKFNLLFETHVGIIEEKKSKVYLRGELAQGIFINFKNILDTMRVRIPFGIASCGVAFRNEITLGQSLFRTLQFDLMEFEYFIDPCQWEKYFSLWQKIMWDFAREIGLDEKKLRWREHLPHERAHYSKKTVDLEYQFPFGWKEIWGLAYRADFDLSQHSKYSGKDLYYQDPLTKKRFIPHVIEPTFGLSRLVLAVIVNAYHEEEVKGKLRIVLKLNPKIAPVKIAVFPLQKDEKLAKIAKKIYIELKKSYYCEYDDIGNIGKMYRRQDEIGTPYCITVDYNTLEDDTVTVRDRDTMIQERITINKLKDYFKKKFSPCGL